MGDDVFNLMANLMAKLIAPAATVSACGVLAIAASTRHASVLGQIHALRRERVAIVTGLQRSGRAPTQAESVRVEGLELLSHNMLKRASFNRWGTVGILACVACVLLTSFAIAGGGLGLPRAPHLAVVSFLFGAGALLLGTGVHIVEVVLSMGQVRLEHQRLEHQRLERMEFMPAEGGEAGDSGGSDA